MLEAERTKLDLCGCEIAAARLIHRYTLTGKLDISLGGTETWGFPITSAEWSHEIHEGRSFHKLNGFHHTYAIAIIQP